jgi:predicted dehydrogenase
MMAHWRYMIDRLASPITDVCAVMATAIPERVDEAGQRYKVDAEDTNYALLKLQSGAIGMITNSWATRPRRDDTMVVQIDGTNGSAVAGRFRCFTQSAAETPEAFIKAARPGGVDLMADWKEVPDAGDHKGPFRQCWEAFLRHVGEDAPYVPTLVEGAKAVQLADLAYKSVAEQRWMKVPELKL